MPAIFKRLNSAYGARRRVLSKQVTYADLTESDNAQTFDFDAALPANHVVEGFFFNVATVFGDGGAGAFDGDLGISGGDTDYWINGADIDGATGKMNATIGVGGATSCIEGAVTPAVTINADVNVDTATAGDLTAYIYYVDYTNAD
jgi:hypothetical protein